jgi:hypothetical protein
MIQLHFKYSFSVFSGSPKLDLAKIPECRVKSYNVEIDDVELVVLCEDREIAEKLKHYYAIKYEIFPHKEKII